MGQLVDGTWYDVWYETGKAGEFVREEATFRHSIGDKNHPAQSGRYLLYVSLACPWAHRALIFRRLKSLEPHIDVCVVHWHMGVNGWTFAPGEAVNTDPEFNSDFLYEIYAHCQPNMTGRITVPVLWDKKLKTIVNNESADIIRMFNTAFNDITNNHDDYYPPELKQQIDTINELVYDQINNGVYKSGFATTQKAYDQHVAILFNGLDYLEERLAKHKYLVGDRLSEADWRLFTTLVRFDCVYNTHFKCTKQRIVDYPNLWDYARHLYQMDGIASTVNWFHIMHHYYGSHPPINPTGIVPMMPDSDWMKATKRG